MSVKTFEKKFRTLNNLNFVSVNFNSISLLAGAPSFLMQPKSIWLAVLSPNYCIYDFDAMNFRHFYINFWLFFIILVPIEILSHYPIIDTSYWLRENVQLAINKVFREKPTV